MSTMSRTSKKFGTLDDMEIIKHPNSPWKYVDGIQEVNTTDEAIDKVIAKCKKDGDF